MLGLIIILLSTWVFFGLHAALCVLLAWFILLAVFIWIRFRIAIREGLL